MTKEEIIKYWLESSNSDFNTMNNMFNSKDYHWSLFIGHLVIEKLLKAVCIYKTESDIPPRTHVLLYLAEKSGIETTDAQKDALDLITTFNISARYPDYKKSFYNKCTKEFTLVHLILIKELRQWLLSMLEKV